ncbi:hypothetical protein LX36DRAFT_404439 [Colletotrichum falcatum]|nr:hypothetical protein LX36DRAFT_404439 [Colletotrichum falcatum]
MPFWTHSFLERRLAVPDRLETAECCNNRHGSTHVPTTTSKLPQHSVSLGFIDVPLSGSVRSDLDLVAIVLCQGRTHRDGKTYHEACNHYCDTCRKGPVTKRICQHVAIASDRPQPGIFAGQLPENPTLDLERIALCQGRHQTWRNVVFCLSRTSGRMVPNK